MERNQVISSFVLPFVSTGAHVVALEDYVSSSPETKSRINGDLRAFGSEIGDFEIFVTMDGHGVLTNNRSGKARHLRFDILGTQKQCWEVLVGKVLSLLDNEEDFLLTDVKSWGESVDLDPRGWFLVKDDSKTNSIVLGYRDDETDEAFLQKVVYSVDDSKSERNEQLKFAIGHIATAVKVAKQD